MERCVAALCVVILIASTGCAEEGFTDLFNGKDLSGWEYGPVPVAKKPIIEKLDKKSATKDQVFEVVDGSIVASGKAVRALYTEKEFNKDFIFKVQFRNSGEKPKDNSGIYIRGPQLQMDAVTEGGAHRRVPQTDEVQGWRLE